MSLARHIPLLPVVLAATLLGCGRNCEPDLRGGTDAERGDLKLRVQTFHDLLRPDLDLCVESVTIVPDLGDASGNILHGRINVEPDLGALFHELCHAVQHQNELPVEHYKPAPGTVWHVLEDGDASEVFAHFCSFGPNIGSFLSDTCPKDPAGLDLYREAADLFVGTDPLSVAEESPVALKLTYTAPSDASVLDVRVAEEGLVLQLDEQTFAIDPWTGEEIPLPASSTEPEDVARGTVGFAFPLSYETVEGAVGTRWVLAHLKRWSSLGCGPPHQQVVAYEDALWSVALDGEALTLGVWEPLPVGGRSP